MTETCPDCIHCESGMCKLSKTACLNYDHFQWSQMVMISPRDLAEKYVSRASFDTLQARAEKAEVEVERLHEVIREQDHIYMESYVTVKEIRKATEELFKFIYIHADKTFLAHATALMEFRKRIMPDNFPNRTLKGW